MTDIKMHATKNKGFTLIEMMIAVAVLAIIIGMVIPNFSRVVAHNKTTAAANDILALTQSARMEALRSRREVVVCASSNGNSCGGTNWAHTIMFIDEDKNGNRNGREKVKLRAQSSANDLVFTNLGNTSKIVFASSGFVKISGDDVDVLRVCSKMAPKSNKILRVGMSMGRTKIKRDETRSTCP